MEIILGKTAGFCYGVKRAVEGAEEIAEKDIYCLGEIVHNKEVIKDLKKKGITFVENIEDSKGTTIIRAHGVQKQVYEKAKQMNIEIKDYTCPMVIKIHNIAEEYAKKGFYIILTGSRIHPESIGTMSFCGNNYSVIEDETDIEEAINKIQKLKMKKLLVISQTTYSLERFEKINKLLKENLPNNIELEIKNTICSATKIRQKETEEIAKKVDYMIIIGGKNSSNTKKLYEIAKKFCKNNILIETEEELNLKQIEGMKHIGIMAGASTPKRTIDQVIKKIK